MRDLQRDERGIKSIILLQSQIVQLCFNIYSGPSLPCLYVTTGWAALPNAKTPLIHCRLPPPPPPTKPYGQSGVNSLFAHSSAHELTTALGTGEDGAIVLFDVDGDPNDDQYFADRSGFDPDPIRQ